MMLLILTYKDSEKWKILEGNIGYINMGILKPEDVE